MRIVDSILRVAPPSASDGKLYGLQLTIKTSDVVGLIYALTRNYQIEEHQWRPDVEPSEQFRHMTNRHYLFISQPCGETVFVKSSLATRCFSKHIGLGHFKFFRAIIPNYWSEISKDFGDVFLLWSQRTADDHGFMCWRDGKLTRAVSSSQAYDYEEYGPAIWGEDFETARGYEGQARTYLIQDTIFKMADNWGVNPNRITPLKPKDKAFCWFVDEHS